MKAPEFVPSMFPAELGPVTEGLMTGASFFHKAGESFVWASKTGKSVGRGIPPIYESVAHACWLDKNLHAIMALIDALRISGATSRGWAADELDRLLEEAPSGPRPRGSVDMTPSGENTATAKGLADLRDKMVKTAVELVLRKGFETTTVHEVCQLLGLDLRQGRAVFESNNVLHQHVMYSVYGGSADDITAIGREGDRLKGLQDYMIKTFHVTRNNEALYRLNLWLTLEGHLLNEGAKESMTQALRIYGEALDEGSSSSEADERLAKALIFVTLLAAQATINYAYLPKTNTSIPHSRLMDLIEKIIVERMVPVLRRAGTESEEPATARGHR